MVQNNRSRRFWGGVQRRTQLFWSAVAGCLLVVSALAALSVSAGGSAGPDLSAEIRLEPAVPALNQPTQIFFVIRNNGTVFLPGPITLHGFIDPGQPPTQDTPGAELTRGEGLGPGEEWRQEITYAFPSEGCTHRVYGWVDRANTVAESDENNNLAALTVCVGNVNCTPDSFEGGGGDDHRASARWFLENLTQPRSLCSAQSSQNPDRDWVKFTVFSGITYTLEIAAPEEHVRASIELDASCGTVASSQAGPLLWQSPINGICYAGVEQAALVGPLTAYSLTLRSASGVVDLYEPDDSCAQAHDLPTNGVRQSHLFQLPADADWVKFNVEAGSTFQMVADNTTPGVAPQITLFASCDQVDAGNSLSSPSSQVLQATTQSAVYYARIVNQNPDSFGADKRYDVRVAVAACVPDASEPDDLPATARLLALDQPGVHNSCPGGDEDWARLALQAGQPYVVQTTDLAFAADTLLTIFSADGLTRLAENDDYGYVNGSRLLFTPPATGEYLVRVRHANPTANGPNTQYSLVAQAGFCQPDGQEGESGDNGPGDATGLTPNLPAQQHNFCADPLDPGLGDQDWLAVSVQAGNRYQVTTGLLGPNTDTVLELYAEDGATLLQDNDDTGTGLEASLVFTAAADSTYYMRVRQYNSTLTGNDTAYTIQLSSDAPPTPTPSPTPTPTPSPTPLPTPSPGLTATKTLILVNAAEMTELYGASAVSSLLDKLFALADLPEVAGALLQVENDPSVAAAYAAWTADAATLADNELANAVTAAVRNRLATFLAAAPQLEAVVIVGGDRVLPFRRVPDQVSPSGPSSTSIESAYATEIVDAAGTVRAALAENQVLTDDYLVDRTPSQWQDRQGNLYDLFLPDYAIGRLVETPAEIGGLVDGFLNGARTIDASAGKALVTGYDFVQDSASTIAALFTADLIPTDSQLIGASWPGASLQTKYLNAAPRVDLYSVNAHSTHTAIGAPDGADLTAVAVQGAAADLRGALVFSLGCHGGLNEAGVLDLPQAFAAKQAHYIGNTGFGWGGSGIVYSEALMRTFARELVRERRAEIGATLATAKQKYYAQARTFNAYDAKILMQVTLYGLPMMALLSAGNLNDTDPFPSAEAEFSPPSSFGDYAVGSAGYRLPASFGAFDEIPSETGTSFTLDDNRVFDAGAPLQPLYFADVSSPAAGELRGVVLFSGAYTDTIGVDPVIALATNEYVVDDSEPAFRSDGFYPAIPFSVRGGLDRAGDTLLLSLGQFTSNPAASQVARNAPATTGGVQRLYDQMSFGAYYSNSPDRNAANIRSVDGILDPATGLASVKVTASDSSGVQQVVVAFTDGDGRWESTPLAFDSRAQTWTGTLSGTLTTQFFVQVVDAAGNVALNDNKGRYYNLVQPAPLAAGQPIGGRIYLPTVSR